MGGKSSAPPPPDYTAAANATAAGNLEAAKYATQANRATQVTPYGTLSWSQGKDAEGKDNNQWTQKVDLSAEGQRLLDQQNKTSSTLAGMQDQAAARVTEQQNKGWNDAAVPKSGTAYTPVAGGTAYTPVAGGTTYTPVAGGSVYDPSKVVNMGALPIDKVIEAQGKVLDASSIRGGDVLKAEAFNFGGGGSERVNVADNTTKFDASKLGSLGTVYDPTKDTNTATQAILSRVDPQLQRRRAAMETQLANQGITRGSEAWTNSQTDQGQQENDAWTQAGLQGINLGLTQQGQTYGQTMSNRGAQSQDQLNLFNQQAAIRNQDIQQAGMNQQASLADAQRALSAQQASASATLAAQNQQFSQTNANNALALQAQNQQFGQGQASNAQVMDAYNASFGQNNANNAQNMAAQAQQFGQNNANITQGMNQQNQQFGQNSANITQGMNQQAQQFGQTNANAALNMSQQNQSFEQQEALRRAGLLEQSNVMNRDLNQLNAIRTGSQVQNPTFGSYNQQQTTAGPDLLSATNAGYQAQVAATNANNANSAGAFGGLVSVASAAAPFMMSDERLKEDIERIGTLSNGVGVYLWRYIGDAVRHTGFIAQDVMKILPDAVKMMDNGFYAVNYAEVLK